LIIIVLSALRDLFGDFNLFHTQNIHLTRATSNYICSDSQRTGPLCFATLCSFLARWPHGVTALPGRGFVGWLNRRCKGD
jgi:hypothetical protein